MTHWQAWMACGLLMSLPAAAQADIFRWDNGQLIPGTQGITPGPRVVLDHHELAFAALLERNLTSARFDFSNLTSARLGGSTLTNANLAGANLSDANLSYSTLTNANLSFADMPVRQFFSQSAKNQPLSRRIISQRRVVVCTLQHPEHTFSPRSCTCRARTKKHLQYDYLPSPVVLLLG